MKNILLALSLTLAVLFAGSTLFEVYLPGYVVVGLYFLFYILTAWIRSSDDSESNSDTATFENDQPHDRSHWPLSGPFRRFGPKTGGFLIGSIFLSTNLLSLLNPFQLVQIVKQTIGNTRLVNREKKSGINMLDYQTKAEYCLPFRGEWLVYNGGYTPKTSHSWDILGQRFALDFVIADENFSRHQRKGTRLEDYYCYGKEILAAADGVVIRIENRVSDAPLVGYGVSDFLARNFIGSHVIIQHAEHEYALYAHLIKGSVTVRPGDKVKQGQIIGKCGHSGNSTEPHLHFHLQDSPDVFNGMGLPITFSQIVCDDQITKNARVQAGDRVKNADLK